MRRLLLVGTVFALSACGASGSGDDDGAIVDGGGGDASTSCNAVVQFEPMMPVAPATIVARGDVFNASGIVTYGWQVRRLGVDVPFTPLDNDSRDIQFEATQAGVYEVWLEVGGMCAGFYGQLNVMQPGAQTRSVRLRLVPPSSVLAPPQERAIIIAGGADFSAGIVSLDAGNLFSLVVRTPAVEPVPAYVRFTSRATPDAVVETFSDATGALNARLVPGRYDVLVVPTNPALPPRAFLDWDPILGTLAIDNGITLGGSVLDAAGAPVAGARVSLTSGGVPSTVATTAADGTFSLRWREGSTVEKVTVVPPVGSDLPRLDAQVEIGAMMSIVIRHAAVASSDVGNTLVRVGGTPAASTDVLVDLALPMAGTIRDGGGTNVLAPAAGSHRITLRTDASGRLPAARFVDGTGSAFIASAGPGAIASIALPLGGSLDAAAPVTVTGHVLRSGGTDRGGARVRAMLTGALAHPGAPVPTVSAGSDGRFTLSLAAGASYEVTLSDPTYDDAALVVDIAAAATQNLGDRTLPAAIAISGEIRATGQSVGARAVGVAALCNDTCTGIDRSRPLGDAVTDAAGRFVVAVPDPGVSPQ
jgi:hypothetical protein